MLQMLKTMKKITLFLIAFLVVIQINAQPIKIRRVSDTFKVTSGSTQLAPDFPAASQGSLFDYAARKYLTDTVLVTGATYTLSAANAGQVLWFSNATYCEITVPQNTMPAGSLVTLWRTGGPVRINAGAGTVRKSYLDSCTMNSLNKPYQVLFRTQNKFYPLGPWED
jgi:hypothetical protein